MFLKKKKQKNEKNDKSQSSVKSWVLTSKERSTHLKVDLKKSSKSEVIASPCTPVAASVSGPGFGQNHSNISGYSADVSAESSVSKLSNPSSVKDESAKFDSTSSSFLENVNSYCAEAHGSLESVKVDECDEFESTKSWFLENVNAYGQSQEVSSSMVSEVESAQSELVMVDPQPIVEDMSGISEIGSPEFLNVRKIQPKLVLKESCPVTPGIEECESPAQPKLVGVEGSHVIGEFENQAQPKLVVVEDPAQPKLVVPEGSHVIGEFENLAQPKLVVVEDPAQPKLVVPVECPNTPLNDGLNPSRAGKRKIHQSPSYDPQNYQFIEASVGKLEKLSLNDELCCQSPLKTRKTADPELGEPKIGMCPETRENVPKIGHFSVVLIGNDQLNPENMALRRGHQNPETQPTDGTVSQKIELMDGFGQNFALCKKPKNSDGFGPECGGFLEGGVPPPVPPCDSAAPGGDLTASGGQICPQNPALGLMGDAQESSLSNMSIVLESSQSKSMESSDGMESSQFMKHAREGSRENMESSIVNKDMKKESSIFNGVDMSTVAMESSQLSPIVNLKSCLGMESSQKTGLRRMVPPKRPNKVYSTVGRKFYKPSQATTRMESSRMMESIDGWSPNSSHHEQPTGLERKVGNDVTVPPAVFFEPRSPGSAQH